MKSSFKSGCKSKYRVFPNVKSGSFGPGSNPVFLNVYDLTPANNYLFWAGVGVFHSGLEVHNVEYAFGAMEYRASGIFEVEPRKCPGYTFRKSIFIGTTFLNTYQVEDFMKRQDANYYGDTYHLLAKNCNHFCDDICFKLTGNHIPKWVNRLAKIGSFCGCILPKALANSPDTTKQDSESERQSLTSSPGWFSSISNHHSGREVSISSLL